MLEFTPSVFLSVMTVFECVNPAIFLKSYVRLVCQKLFTFAFSYFIIKKNKSL